MSIGALEGVDDANAGLASGLINTSQQVGGALGIAVLSTVAVSHTEALLATSPATPAPVALTAGFEAALYAGLAFALAAALAAAVLIRRERRATAPAGVELEQAA